MENAAMLKVAVHLKQPNITFRDAFAHQKITTLSGPSGCGKTTLLRTIAGLAQPIDSSISFNQTVWQDSQKGIYLPPIQRRIGFAFQQANLFPHLTVFDNIAYGYKRSKQQYPTCHPVHLIETFALQTLANRLPQTLSGGERQRVALLMALSHAPQLLLLDEALSALDHEQLQQLLQRLREHQHQQQLTVINVTHQPMLFESFSDSMKCFTAAHLNHSSSLQFQSAQVNDAQGR